MTVRPSSKLVVAAMGMLAGVVAAASPAAAGPHRRPALSIEPSTDRYGADYRQFDLPVADVEPCRRACGDDPACLAYTYAAPGLVGPQARCFLKNAVAAPSPKPGCTSGIKLSEAARLSVEPSTDRYGSDYRQFDLAVPDVELCRRSCAEDSRCSAYTYAEPGLVGPQARCFLKDAAPVPVAKAGCISGARPGALPPAPPAPTIQEPPPDPTTFPELRRPRLPGAIAEVPRRRDCGTGDDPGCQESRDGGLAFDAAAWREVTRSLRAERNPLRRVDRAVELVGAEHLTARQLTWILDQLSSEPVRLDLARKLVARVIDPQRAEAYASRFDNRILRRDFVEVLRLGR